MFGLFGKKTDADLAHHSRDVQQWRREHDALKKQAGKIAEAVGKGKTEKARNELKKLETLALQHLMSEDIRFYEMKKAVEAVTETTPEDRVILEAMKEFEESFRDTKQVLIRFFSHYKKPETPLDEQFEKDFGAIVNALVARIDFEESTLYEMMDQV